MSNKLFISNIADADLSIDCFASLFTPFGNITQIKVNPVKHIGWVEYALDEEASRAIHSLNSTSSTGMHVGIHQNKGPYFPTPKQKLFVKGIPQNINDDAKGKYLNDIFSPFGVIQEIKLIGPSSAIIRFYLQESATVAFDSFHDRENVHPTLPNLMVMYGENSKEREERRERAEKDLLKKMQNPLSGLKKTPVSFTTSSSSSSSLSSSQKSERKISLSLFTITKEKEEEKEKDENEKKRKGDDKLTNVKKVGVKNKEEINELVEKPLHKEKRKREEIKEKESLEKNKMIEREEKKRENGKKEKKKEEKEEVEDENPLTSLFEYE